MDRKNSRQDIKEIIRDGYAKIKNTKVEKYRKTNKHNYFKTDTHTQRVPDKN